MREADIDRLRRLAAEKRAAKPAEPEKVASSAPKFDEPAPVIEEFEDSLGEVDDEATDEAARDAYMRSVVESLDIVRAYDLFSGKGPVSGKEDSSGNIFVRCPTPDHEDKHPSAQVKPSTNEWVCHACGIGGDPVALVAAALGKDFRNGRDYMEITKEICRELGESFYIDSFGHERIEMPVREDPEPEVPVHGDGEGPEGFFDLEEAFEKGDLTPPKPTELPPELDFMLDSLDEVGDSAPRSDRIMEKIREKAGPKKAPEAPVKGSKTAVNTGENTPKTVKTPPGMPKFNVGAMVEGQKPVKKAKTTAKQPVSEPEEPETDQDEPEIDTPAPNMNVPTLDWRNIVSENTFIHEYCTAGLDHDAAPEEFHFWNAVMAVGMVLGRHLCLDDQSEVFANLYVCEVARTGTGKSRAARMLDDVLYRVIPPGKDTSIGVQKISIPASGEALLDSFSNYFEDDQKTRHYQSVRGLIRLDEAASLLKASMRLGNTTIDMLNELYNADKTTSISSRGSGNTLAVEPFCSLLTGLQPNRIQALITPDMVGAGFVNRFVWAYGHPREPLAVGTATDRGPSLTQAVVKLGQIKEWVERQYNGPSSPSFNGRLLMWDPSARDEWTNFFHTVVHPAMSADDTDLMQRVDLVLKKLILILSANMGKTSVTPEAVEQVKKIWPYLKDGYRITGDHIRTSDLSRKEQKVMDAIRRHLGKPGRENGVTAAELWKRGLKNNGLVTSMEELNKIVKTLHAAGEIRSREVNRSTRYTLAKGG